MTRLSFHLSLRLTVLHQKQCQQVALWAVLIENGLCIDSRGFATLTLMGVFINYHKNLYPFQVSEAIDHVCGQDAGGRCKKQAFLDLVVELERRRQIEQSSWWDFKALDTRVRITNSRSLKLLVFLLPIDCNNVMKEILQKMDVYKIIARRKIHPNKYRPCKTP